MGILSTLQGTAVNALAIIVGAFIGILLPNLPTNYKNTTMQIIGLAVLIIGIDMALDTGNVLILIISGVIGGIIGEALRLEERLDQLGKKLEGVMLGNKQNSEEGKIAKAFVFATLIFCVGSMGILGALESGLQFKHEILYTKAILDGVSSVVFASTMGIGIMFSSVAVFLYQGIIALLASSIADFLNEGVINEVRAVGGLLIMGIGVNLLEIKNVRVANLLPAIFVAALIMIAKGFI